jgi:hypothetical protein
MQSHHDVNTNNTNSATPPNPNSPSPVRLGVFGGESTGFAHGVETLAAKTFYEGRANPDEFGVSAGMKGIEIPRSIFNRYALFNFRGLYGGLTGDVSKGFFDRPNNELMGGSDARNISISKMMEFYNTNYPRISYKPSDFLYCKYYKQIPVNHLITLRRFPVPVEDNIFDLSKTPGSKDGNTATASEAVDATQTAGVTAVTYMGEQAGNKLEDLLTMSYGLTYKEITSEMESVSSGDGGYTQQPFYSKMGGIGRATADAFKGISSRQKFASQLNSTGDQLGTTYANFVIGPVNVINKTNIRDRGLNFSQDMKLTFEYELKSLNYVNPKIAMIDIISNMLTMTYNNGQFFGGGQRYYGSAGAVASQFGDINKLKQGDFSGYIGSVVTDVETGFKNVFGGGTGEFNLENGLDGLLKVGKTMLGNMLGGFLSENVGAVSGTQATKTFVSGEPTGDWHVTIGNPLNPIVTMGNMYCDNSTMTLGHGLGYDDFPMEVKFEIDLKHGKPRDKGDIENMFNAGRGRIYASAAGESDILNLAGKDVATYGSVKTGKVSLEGTQSTPPSSVKNEEISNIKKQSNADIFTDDDAAYVSNMVSMIIDS